MVRQNQLQQQRYLNQQYKLQQQKEQRQMWQQQELDRMKAELLKLKQELESQKHASAYSSPQYGVPAPATTFVSPAPSASEYEALTNLGGLEYGAPAPAQKPHAEYGAPAAPVIEEGVHVVESPLEAALNEPVSCDEREQLGHTRIIAVKTLEDKICNVKLQTFDRCPGSDPIILGYDEAEHPGACEGITKFLNVVQFVGNTASRVPGHAIRAATVAVDAFDTVKDFYTDLYRKWRQRRKEEKLVTVVVKEPEIVKGGYKK
jgi:hypothetical protein